MTVTTKFVVTAFLMKLVLTAVTTKLVVAAKYYDEAGCIGILLRFLPAPPNPSTPNLS